MCCLFSLFNDMLWNVVLGIAEIWIRSWEQFVETTNHENDVLVIAQSFHLDIEEFTYVRLMTFKKQVVSSRFMAVKMQVGRVISEELPSEIRMPEVACLSMSQTTS